MAPHVRTANCVWWEKWSVKGTEHSSLIIQNRCIVINFSTSWFSFYRRGTQRHSMSKHSHWYAAAPSNAHGLSSRRVDFIADTGGKEREIEKRNRTPHFVFVRSFWLDVIRPTNAELVRNLRIFVFLSGQKLDLNDDANIFALDVYRSKKGFRSELHEKYLLQHFGRTSQ